MIHFSKHVILHIAVTSAIHLQANTYPVTFCFASINMSFTYVNMLSTLHATPDRLGLKLVLRKVSVRWWSHWRQPTWSPRGKPITLLMQILNMYALVWYLIVLLSSLPPPPNFSPSLASLSFLIFFRNYFTSCRILWSRSMPSTFTSANAACS